MSQVIRDIQKRDQAIFNLAHEFLLDFENVSEEMIGRQLNEAKDVQIKSIDDVFYRLMESLQNANMKSNVIGKSIGGIDKLRDNVIPALEAMENFANEDELLEKIFTTLKPHSSKTLEEHIKDDRSIWKKYAKSLMEAKDFLNQFENFDDFRKWVDFFNNDDRARAALPMILSREIYGLGFALACDFLKELGYVNFGKPDVHIKNIFYELGLSKSKDDYRVLKDIVRIANNVGLNSYQVDKLFWLIGSGKFYLFEIEIGRQRDKFIAYVKKNLSLENTI